MKSKFQVTIPAKLREGNDLREGDFMGATLTSDGILFKPKDAVDQNAAAPGRCAATIRSVGPGPAASSTSRQRCQRTPGPGEFLTMPVVSKTRLRLYPPDGAIIAAWAAANPDPDTGLTPSRPTAVRRIIRTACHTSTDAPNSDQDRPASREDLRPFVASILDRLDSQEHAS